MKSFHGTASASFKQTASASGQGGTTTVTLDRVANGLQFPKLVPVSLGHGFVSFTGPPSGGPVTINDSYQFTSNNGANNDSGGQTASGPTLGYPAAANGGISFYPAQFGCRYGVIFSFAIATTQIGDWPYGPGDTHPDGEAIGLIYGPERPIPANLELSGTATVGWQADPSAGNGTYRATVSGSSAWAQEYTTLLNDSGMAPGTATISWNFSPGTGPPGSCSVGGGTIAGAAPDPLAQTAQQVTQTCTCSEANGVYTCKCTPVASCKQAEAQQKNNKKKWLRLVAVATTVEAVQLGSASIFSLSRGLTSIGEATGIAGLVSAGVSALLFDAAGNDPPDRNWRSIVKARLIGPTSVKPNPFLGASGARALSGIFRQVATVNGLVHALVVSTNRRRSATAAKSKVWVRRQTAAMGRYAIQAANAIDQLVSLIQASKAALSRRFPPITPQAVKMAAADVRAHGLPRRLVALARRYGIPASVLAQLERGIESQKRLPGYATSIYGILSNDPSVHDLQALASAMLGYGELLPAVG